ncbi:MAG: MipA/OmpV family protein [Gammaproteobacteria bacterium]
MLRRRRFFFAAVALLAPALAAAQPPWPKFEAGAGAAVAATPTYRGSDHYSVVALPFPYFVYRGDNLRVTRSGARVQALTWDRFSLGVSGAFSLPGNDGEDPAREGMPALDPTLEVGPSLDFLFSRGDTAWCLCVPIRSVTATDGGHWQGAGWLAHPQLRMLHVERRGDRALTTSMFFGPKFADRRYHAYFYEVQPQYAIAGRPAYAAGGGYSGLSATLSFSVRGGRWGAGAGVVSDWLEGAAFEDSPLVDAHASATVVAWLTYRLWSRGSADETDEVRD